MTRMANNNNLRQQLVSETIEYHFDIINDKLDNISTQLEEMSKHLYEIAKYDSYQEDHKYADMFDDLMGNPIKQLNEFFEVKK